MHKTTMHHRHASSTTRAAMLCAALLSGAMLAACGGGDDGDGDDGDDGALSTLSISGVAATSIAGSSSNALANAAVTAHCRSGYGIGMTDAKGAYSITVTAPVAGPCVLTLTTYNAVLTLRSIAKGDGARANITPATEMLVSYIATQAGVGAGANTSPTVLPPNPKFIALMENQAGLAESMAGVQRVVNGLIGAALPQLPADYLGGPLTPKTQATAGDANDRALDSLRARNLLTATGYVSTGALTAVNNEARTRMLPAVP